MKHTFKDQTPVPTLIEPEATTSEKVMEVNGDDSHDAMPVVKESYQTETFPLKGKIDGEPMVNLRSEPNGNIIAILQEGTAVDILGATEDWTKVQAGHGIAVHSDGTPVSADNKTGYVMTKYVKGV